MITNAWVDEPTASRSIAARAAGEIHFDPTQLAARLSLSEQPLFLSNQIRQIRLDPEQ